MQVKIPIPKLLWWQLKFFSFQKLHLTLEFRNVNEIKLFEPELIHGACLPPSIDIKFGVFDPLSCLSSPREISSSFVSVLTCSKDKHRNQACLQLHVSLKFFLRFACLQLHLSASVLLL